MFQASFRMDEAALLENFLFFLCVWHSPRSGVRPKASPELAPREWLSFHSFGWQGAGPLACVVTRCFATVWMRFGGGFLDDGLSSYMVFATLWMIFGVRFLSVGLCRYMVFALSGLDLFAFALQLLQG